MAALLAALLTACTGTFEEPLPLLLVAGFGDEVALVEDNFHAFAAGDAPQRELTFIDGSRQGAAATVRDLDVADRDGDRHPLYVLSRGGGDAYLERFDTRDVDRADGAGFAPLAGEGALDLGAALGATAFEGPYCPDALAVSRTGRFVALLDDPAACGTSGVTTVFVLDVATWSDPAVVYPAEPALAPDFAAVPPVWDQRRDGFYFVAGSRPPEVRFAEVDEDAADGSDAVATPSDVARPDLDEAVSLAPVGERLLVADDDAYVVLSPEDDAEPEGPVEAVAGLRELFALPGLVTGTAAYRTATSVVVHGELLEDVDPAVDEAAVNGVVAGTVGPNDFLFALAPQRIAIVDLLREPGARLDPLRVDVAELQAPAAISWIRAGGTPAP